jgi:molybdate/tungstate transport system ATP-binding protein
MLSIEDISLKIGTFELKNIYFKVDKGDYFVILGLSGVGKSLLLETIAGLLKPDSGKIILRGKDISKEKVQDLNISIVYQDAVLFPHKNVYENIAYPLRSKEVKNIKEKVNHFAELTGIADKLDRKPETLSGGEIQRTALARSLASGSDIFLLDEPLSSLDSKSAFELRTLFRKLNREGITIVHVTHSYEEAISLASKIGVMENGRLVDVGSPKEIFHHPKSEFIAHFIGVKNFLAGKLKSIPDNELKEFDAGGAAIFTLTDAEDGEAFLMISPEEISISNMVEVSSSRNHFKGIITDIAPARIGIDVTVNIGLDLISVISSDSLKELDLKIGKEVWINFKASSCRIYK